MFNIKPALFDFTIDLIDTEGWVSKFEQKKIKAIWIQKSAQALVVR